MTRDALRNGLIDMATITHALMAGRGDLFYAAGMLGVTGRELDSYIRSSDELQQFVVAIGQVKASEGYARMSADQFTDQLDLLTKGYKVAGSNGYDNQTELGIGVRTRF